MAGALTAVAVPSATCEAARDLAEVEAEKREVVDVGGEELLDQELGGHCAGSLRGVIVGAYRTPKVFGTRGATARRGRSIAAPVA